MEKKYQIFISSTFVDLVTARQKVMDTILDLHQIPAGMEMFPAADDDQWTHIKAEIDKSDYYVLILGHRYGSMAPDGLSWTEKEYDYAREQQIPVLAFIINNDVPVAPSMLDDSANARKRLEKLKQKAKGSKLCKFWSSPDELAAMVSTSLAHSFATHPGVGWVRGNQAVSPEITEELVALNRENRQLKAELDGLKRINDKKPSIVIGLNNEYGVTLGFKPLNPELLPIPKIIESIPEHLADYTSQKDIDDYNDSLPEDIEKVKSYNRKLKLHFLAKHFGFEFKIKVSNLGTSKANNIHVDVEFPNSVLVLEGEKEDYTLPDTPSLTANPLRKAERAYMAAKSGVRTLGASSLFRSFNDLGSLRLMPTYGRIQKDLLFKNPPNPGFYTDLEGNKISLYCKELIHTRMRESDDTFILVPAKTGEYEIKVYVMCEEYLKPEVVTIPLNISDDQQ